MPPPCLARPRLLLSLLLAGCAPAPPARAPSPPPALAEVLAPQPPRPELVPVLTALLRGDQDNLLLPIGHDTLRCEAHLATALPWLACEGVIEEAGSVPELVRKVHTGDLMRRAVRARLHDAGRFREQTGLTPLTEGTLDLEGVNLGEPLGLVRMEVGERGEVVRARFAGLDGPEEIEAGSLLELGARLRERTPTLASERAERQVMIEEQTHYGPLLGAVQHLPAGGWSMDGVTTGLRPDEQPKLRSLSPLPIKSLMPRYLPPVLWQAWPRRLAGIELETESGRGTSGRFVVAGLVDKLVVAVEAYADWSVRTPAPEGPLRCALHDASLRAWGAAGFERRSGAADDRCVWRWREGDQQLELELAERESSLKLSWQPRLERLEREATATLHERVCRQCAQIRPGTVHQDHTYDRTRVYRVLSVDAKQCTMSTQTLRELEQPEPEQGPCQLDPHASPPFIPRSPSDPSGPP